MSTGTAPGIWIAGPGDSGELPENAVHGDMLVDPTAGDRTLGVRFVQALDDDGSELPKKRLVRKDETGSGYCSVPAEITRAFTDPVSYYLPHLEIETDGAPPIRRDDWFAIELDAGHHGELLRGQSGGRDIAANRRVVYFLNDYGAGEGYHIWNPTSASEGDSMGGWKPIDADTPDAWLGKNIGRDTDHVPSAAQRRNREICETRFLDKLEGKTGEMLTLVSLPDTVDDFRESGGSMVTGTLVAVRQAAPGELPAAVVSYTEWVEDPDGGDNVPVDHELVFEPTVLASDGPFGNVHFWVNRDAGMMLYPPSR